MKFRWSPTKSAYRTKIVVIIHPIYLYKKLYETEDKLKSKIKATIQKQIRNTKQTGFT